MTIAEKLEWLAAAENFLNLGNVTGAMNALREILTAAQFSRDPDTLAFAAELSFYRGDTAAAEDYLGQLTEAASRTGGGGFHCRGEFVRALLELSRFDMKPAVLRLEAALRQPSVRQPQTGYDKCTRVRLDRYLADACYLLGDAAGAAERLFDASRLAEKDGMKAELYSKALFLTAYNPRPLTGSWPSAASTINFLPVLRRLQCPAVPSASRSRPVWRNSGGGHENHSDRLHFPRLPPSCHGILSGPAPSLV